MDHLEYHMLGLAEALEKFHAPGPPGSFLGGGGGEGGGGFAQ